MLAVPLCIPLVKLLFDPHTQKFTVVTTEFLYVLQELLQM